MPRFIEHVLLFFAAAVAEIAGCFLVFRVARSDGSRWLIFPAAASLALFAWLLTLPAFNAAGRIYAAYGGVYIATALIWAAVVEKRPPDARDLAGAALCLAGMAVIAARR